MVAPQQIIKNKGQGFYIFYITKLSVLQYVSALAWVWGFVFGLVYKLSVKIGKTIAKRKTSLDLTLKVTIAKG
jgi:hypothetical protein